MARDDNVSFVNQQRGQDAVLTNISRERANLLWLMSFWIGRTWLELSDLTTFHLQRWRFRTLLFHNALLLSGARKNSSSSGANPRNGARKASKNRSFSSSANLVDGIKQQVNC